MAAKTGINIYNPSNLVLYVDAANPNSYQSATYPDKLFSMVPGGKDFQMYGTTLPYYTTQYGGGFGFSSSSLQRFLIDPVPLTTESFAVELWFKAGKASTDANGYTPILGCGDVWSAPYQSYKGWTISYMATITASSYGVAVTSSNGEENYRQNGPTFTVGQVYNLLLQRNTINQKFELYMNGSLYDSFTLSNTASLGGAPAQIGSRPYQYGSFYNNHTYYSIKMYKNIQFTAAEVQQNFNAVRNKFRI